MTYNPFPLNFIQNDKVKWDMLSVLMFINWNKKWIQDNFFLT